MKRGRRRKDNRVAGSPVTRLLLARHSLLACAGLLVACAGRGPPTLLVFATLPASDGSVLSAAVDAIDHHPDDPTVYLDLSRRCLEAGARHLCDQAVENKSYRDVARAFVGLGFADAAPAEAVLTSATLQPALRYRLALSVARLIAEGQPDEASLLRAQADLVVAQNVSSAKAVPTGGSVDQVSPELADPFELRLVAADLALAAGDFASATTILQQTLDAGSPLRPATRDLAITLGDRIVDRAVNSDHEATDQARRLFSTFNQQAPDESITAAEQLVERYPNSSLLFIGLGLARLKGGNEPGAVDAFEHAKTLCAYDPEPDYQLARLHERRGRYARAVYFLQRGLSQAPTWSRGLWMMTDVALLANEPTAAEQALNRLKLLYPDDLKVDLGRARIYLDGNDGLQALAVLKEATRHHRNDIRASLALAKAALTLRERTPAPQRRAELLKEAERALDLAQQVDKNQAEVQALQVALDKAKGKG